MEHLKKMEEDEIARLK